MARMHEWWRVGDVLDGEEERLARDELDNLPHAKPGETVRLHAVLLWKTGKTPVLVEQRTLAGPDDKEWVVIAVGRELVVQHVRRITGIGFQDGVSWVERRKPDIANGMKMLAHPIVSVEETL